MNSSIFIVLELAAGAALLIWAVRLVRTGFERAFGGHLRLWLRRSTSNRVRAASCGMVTALLMQSSTAVAILMAGFVSSRAIAAVSGVAILLGADLGSALVAQLLISPVSLVAPLLIVCGVIIFLRSQRRQPRQIGRILIGLGLVFVSLDLIRSASSPLVSNPSVGIVMSYFANEMLLAFTVAALFAWLVHSSVAAVLLFVAMAGQGIMQINAASAMVLGANLGGAMIAVGLTLRADAAVRRAILSNVVLRGGGAALALAILSAAGPLATHLGNSADRQILNLHLAFNVVVVVAGLPIVGIVYRCISQLVPDKPDLGPGTEVSALDPEALSHPQRALACAMRELVNSAGRVEGMYRKTILLFQKYDEELAREIRADAGRVERIALELRLFLANIKASDDGNTRSKVFEFAGIASELEAAADVIARKMVGHAEKMARRKQKFSEDGWRELTDFHDSVLRNMQSAVMVLMSADPALARELVEQKEAAREAARRLEKRHLQRLKEGLVESIETSSVHLDMLRAMKEVNTSFAKIAYPTLSESGELLESRLATG
jgi:phosphate:Na+ symporter